MERCGKYLKIKVSLPWDISLMLIVEDFSRFPSPPFIPPQGLCFSTGQLQPSEPHVILVEGVTSIVDIYSLFN